MNTAKRNGTDLPHLSRRPLLQRSHPVQGVHTLLGKAKSARRRARHRLASPLPHYCTCSVQDAPRYWHVSLTHAPSQPFFSAAWYACRPMPLPVRCCDIDGFCANETTPTGAAPAAKGRMPTITYRSRRRSPLLVSECFPYFHVPEGTIM